jgi:heme/copper-type cytochrome/quinol oxidase subunit 4
MPPKTHSLGWTRFLLAVVLLLCVLCATTAVASHLHLSSEGQGDVHCSLCMLGSTLVAVVVALSLFWNRILFVATSESESPGFVRITVHSIRPPPLASLFP